MSRSTRRLESVTPRTARRRSAGAGGVAAGSHGGARRSTAVVLALAVCTLTGATARPAGAASEPTDGATPTTGAPTTTVAAAETPVEQPAGPTSTDPVDPTTTTTMVEPPAIEAAGEPPATDERGDSLSDEVVLRLITFPVIGRVTYYDDWGDCRDHCERRHAGNDLIGQRLQPIVAPEDGVIEHLSVSPTGGHCLRLRLADGWAWVFCHLNNDTPGTDDGSSIDWIVPKGLTLGSKVRAGTVIGFMGDSGNSENSVPHLHLELVNPAGERRNPYPTLQLAEADRFCATGRAGTSGGGAEAGLGPSVQLLTFDGGSMLVDQTGGYAAHGTAQWTGRVPGCVPVPYPDIDLDSWPRPETLLLRGRR